jgi:hypothetical protein
MQSLPILLVAAVLVALVSVKVLQQLQLRVFHVVPFGMVGRVHINDVCASILLGGLFILYLGE